MYNNLWSKLKPRDKERKIVRWIEKFRPQIEDLINASDDKIHHFNYLTEVVEWNYIKLYDNGEVFASCDLGLINTPGELLKFITEAIDIHFFDYMDPEEEDE